MADQRPAREGLFSDILDGGHELRSVPESALKRPVSPKSAAEAAAARREEAISALPLPSDFLCVCGMFSSVHVFDPADLDRGACFRFPSEYQYLRRVAEVRDSSLDDPLLAVGPYGHGGISLFDFRTKTLRATLKGHTDSVEGLACVECEFGSLVVSGQRGKGRLMAHDSRGGELRWEATEEESPETVHRIHWFEEFSREDVFVGAGQYPRPPQLCRVGLEKGGVKGWFVEEGGNRGSGFVMMGCVPNRDMLLSVIWQDPEPHVQLWSASEYVPVGSLKLPSWEYTVLCVGDDLVLVGLMDGTIQVWDLRNQSEAVSSFSGVASSYVSDMVQVSEDRFASTGGDSSVSVWNPWVTDQEEFLIERTKVTAGATSLCLMHCEME